MPFRRRETCPGAAVPSIALLDKVGVAVIPPLVGRKTARGPARLFCCSGPGRACATLR
jgi:hypothetical protein